MMTLFSWAGAGGARAARALTAHAALLRDRRLARWRDRGSGTRISSARLVFWSALLRARAAAPETSAPRIGVAFCCFLALVLQRSAC